MTAEAQPAFPKGLVEALVRSIDEARLRSELAAWLASPGAVTASRHDAAERASGAQPPAARDAHTEDVLRRIVLADLLDESILGAQSGDKAFPLRLFLGQLGASLGEDTAFALACGLNFYFRAPAEDEERMRIGVEVSRLYYRFAHEAKLEAPLVAQVSPLLASLLSGQLTRLSFESVDGATAFDSRVHEREPGADPAGARVLRPASFACCVTSNQMVRAKARVWT